MQAQAEDPRSQLAQYRIAVTTSDLRGAGTDASVFVQLFGAESQSDRLPLVVAQPGAGEGAAGAAVGAFERGRRSEFLVTARRVGLLRKLWIGHDNRGE